MTPESLDDMTNMSYFAPAWSYFELLLDSCLKFVCSFVVILLSIQ